VKWVVTLAAAQGVHLRACAGWPDGYGARCAREARI